MGATTWRPIARPITLIMRQYLGYDTLGQSLSQYALHFASLTKEAKIPFSKESMIGGEDLGIRYGESDKPASLIIKKESSMISTTVGGVDSSTLRDN